MKSSDEIKKGLECCAASYADCNSECPYKRNCDGSQILKDALALIQQLEAERDAAVADLKGYILKPRKVCSLCKNRNKPICNMCEGCDVFEWRGVQKEE